MILKEKGKVTKEGRRRESEKTYSLFCNLRQRWFVISFRCFGTAYRPIFNSEEIQGECGENFGA